MAAYELIVVGPYGTDRGTLPRADNFLQLLLLLRSDNGHESYYHVP